MKRGSIKVRKLILKNTRRHAIALAVQYLIMIVYIYITFFIDTAKFKYDYLIFLPIFLSCVLVNSKGYFIDLLFLNASKIEGEILEIKKINGILNTDVVGSKRTIRTSKGKLITINLFDNIDEKSAKRQNLGINDKRKTIYYYLKLSKVTFFVEYAKESDLYYN